RYGSFAVDGIGGSEPVAAGPGFAAEPAVIELRSAVFPARGLTPRTRAAGAAVVAPNVDSPPHHAPATRGLSDLGPGACSVTDALRRRVIAVRSSAKPPTPASA